VLICLMLAPLLRYERREAVWQELFNRMPGFFCAIVNFPPVIAKSWLGGYHCRRRFYPLRRVLARLPEIVVELHTKPKISSPTALYTQPLFNA
jgi:hypothetical protein